MPLLTERELRKMSVQPIYALCGGGLGSGLLVFLPILIVAGATLWWLIAWMLVCLIGLIAALVYVRRAP